VPRRAPVDLRRESLKAGAALHQHDAELVFQLLDGGRQSRLRDAEIFGGAAKMLRARQSNEEFELVDHAFN
jgi:hypothetical protein